jgi:hypothetical protein
VRARAYDLVLTDRNAAQHPYSQKDVHPGIQRIELNEKKHG